MTVYLVSGNYFHIPVEECKVLAKSWKDYMADDVVYNDFCIGVRYFIRSSDIMAIDTMLGPGFAGTVYMSSGNFFKLDMIDLNTCIKAFKALCSEEE